MKAFTDFIGRPHLGQGSSMQRWLCFLTNLSPPLPTRPDHKKTFKKLLLTPMTPSIANLVPIQDGGDRSMETRLATAFSAVHTVTLHGLSCTFYVNVI